MDAGTLAPRIRAKIVDGFLPKEFLPRVFGGPGTGKLCDACETTISEGEIEFEADLPKGGIVRFHLQCFTLWQKEREADEKAADGST